MTTPDGNFPPGTITDGDLSPLSGLTEASWRAGLNITAIAPWQNAHEELQTKVVGPIAGQAGSIEGLDVRVTSLENGGTLYTYPSNGVWTNPGQGKVGVAVVNGGQCGANGFQANANTGGATPGSHGGYQYREFFCEGLPETVLITVGAPGITNFQLGGLSSFGGFLIGTSGTQGSMLTSRGAVSSASAPGAGGAGGGMVGDSLPGQRGFNGQASALALGGTGGSNAVVPQSGTDGDSIPLDGITPCGGGGGGGGGCTVNITGSGGAGGAGGAPGGGGGGAGLHGQFGSPRLGGPGGAGRVYVIFSPS
ncbi:hypothetical protein JGU71_28160 [Antrihabitans sp. YC3-6]|uniref:Uncharacterized protein n=1 Tax=Antrihabitans stalagmiti TaxID=2799499 RepID=A0A934NX47_9NOCA|nr:hypothetical protein [Antrihabitans stalagmiti]MBJ8342770.1 hypothetical protein [Antrihabitans stalagmiti]